MDMYDTDTWIWIPHSMYPGHQTTVYSALADQSCGHYTVAEFMRTYHLEQAPAGIRLRVSGDTAFQLFLNGQAVISGPPCAGGDFIGNETAREQYAYETELDCAEKTVTFLARVRMMPVQICEYSRGHGGFMMRGEAVMPDGSIMRFGTDSTWMCRMNGAYCTPCMYDGRILPEPYIPSEVVPDIWQARSAPIPVREEHMVAPEGSDLVLMPGEQGSMVLEMERIMAGFVSVRAEAEGEVAVTVQCREQEEKGTREDMTFSGSGAYRGFTLHSAGNLAVSWHNRSQFPARIEIRFIETCYPVSREAKTTVDDAQLTQVLSVCRGTLRICRQTHHLDSPRHCEPLACTGDYYIQSLMTPFSFGDLRLAAFDVERTAVSLERENGRMFHTSYSLIWVRMLRDLYWMTGNASLLVRCLPALRLLLKRFSGYLGSNDLLETPPDYMFVDWIYIDGISLHHPPKALGQTCLNLFYYDALKAAGEIFSILSLDAEAVRCASRAKTLRQAVNSLLFDPGRGAYIEGLNTPTPESLLGQWMPRNVEKRYCLKHSNILAACVGICDEALGRELVKRVMLDEIEGPVQPYFLHFLFEAIFRLGLRETYTLPLLERWKAPVAAFPKGLPEGFVKPEPGYQFDHSHAWGGTPLYSLPKALLGLEITEPGMKGLALSPSLLGLQQAHVELITPHGLLTCDVRRGEEPHIQCPDGIRCVIRTKPVPASV